MASAGSKSAICSIPGFCLWSLELVLATRRQEHTQHNSTNLCSRFVCLGKLGIQGLQPDMLHTFDLGLISMGAASAVSFFLFGTRQANHGNAAP